MKRITTIEQAKELQSIYLPNDTVTASIMTKNIIMFVAPTACGKTYIMNSISALNQQFQRIPTFTTREMRADDDTGMFRYLPHDETHIHELLHKIAQGSIVQYVVHPSGRFYGSEPQDYPGKYNMLATLSFIVEPIMRLPFKSARIIGIVTDVHTWEAWFSKRFPLGHPERSKRLQEAIQSLEWLLAHQHDRSFIWAYNKPNEPETTATAIIDTILYNKEKIDASEMAEAIRNRAKEML